MRLSDALFQATGLRRNDRPVDLDKTILSPILTFISTIYFLPMTWRKLFLDACRIQQPIYSNETLRNAAQNLDPPVVYIPWQDEVFSYNLNHLAAFFECILYSPVLVSMTSYFLRAESTYYVDDFLAEKWKSFDKEMQAALESRSVHQRLAYTGLFRVDNRNMHPQLQYIPKRLQDLYSSGIHRLRSEFSREQTGIILPAYNRRKNVSYMTQLNYYDSSLGLVDESSRRFDITTLDLLKHYHRTGNRVGGPLEVRQAWFFNDLKPRTYYCLGGDAFWAGLYIQPIANKIAEFLPSTDPFSRFTVSRVGVVTDDHILITYDYSSFTSSLGELQFFLFWLANELRNVPVDVLDPRYGVRTLDLGEMLLEYNELVNQYQAFSVGRFFPLMEEQIFHQGRNGSLGTKGNIVLSTALHGAALASATGKPDDDCCVGDDALANILKLVLEIFISCVNNLGSIARDKFSVIPRPGPLDNPSEHAFKFLKRPINVSHQGYVVTGFLDFFPDLAGALDLDDGIHTNDFSKDTFGAVKTFVMQWGRFLLRVAPHMTELGRLEDLEFLLGGIRFVYEKFHLPFEGGLPGQTVVVDKETMLERRLEVLIPPCDSVEVFFTPWLELLLARFHGQVITEPLTVGGTVAPPVDVYVGQEFNATSDVTFLTLCVDLGLLTEERFTRDVDFDEIYVRKMSRLIATGQKMEPILSRYTVCASIPWFIELSIPYQADMPHNYDDVVTVVDSMFSGTQ